MQNKRGQITIFIILGIIIVFVLAFIFFITRITVERGDVLTRPVVEVVPTELNPVVVYTEDCVRKVGIDGLVLAGQQGGYVYPKEYGQYSAEATDSDGIMFTADTVIPYWLYNKVQNGINAVDLVSLKPPLKRTGGVNSIEKQLDRYMNENLKDCLADYEIFTEQDYEVLERGEVDTTTTIAPGKVTFYAKYPIQISKGDVESKISNFFADILIDLHGMYQIAENITGLEHEYSFIERGTLNWITSFTAIDRDKLPPMTDMDFDFIGDTFWIKRDVEKNLKLMFSTYVPMFRIMPSRNFYRYEYPANIEYADVIQRIYDDTIINVEKPNRFDVRFDYLPLWPIYLYVDESRGLIRPDSMSVSVPMLFMGLQNYRTVYDISYPVMITLSDPDALNQEGYEFIFALEANIRANEPVEDDEILAPPVAFFEESMLCNKNQRNSIDYMITVKDNYDDSPIAEAQVFFGLPGEDCFIGFTDERGILTTKFPIAYGGILKVTKEGYLATGRAFDPKGSADELRAGESTDIGVKLDKFDIVDVSVDKMKVFKVIRSPKEDKVLIPLLKYSPLWATTAGAMGIPLEARENIEWKFNPMPLSLEENEMAVITFTRVSGLDQDFSAAATVTGNMSQEIRLVPGVYDITIQLFLEEEVVIPEEERCFAKPGLLPGGILPKDIGWDDLEQEKCITIDAIEFDEFPNGGADFSTEDTYWQLTGSNFYPSNEIVFYAVSPAITDIPEVSGVRVAEDLEQMGLIGYYSAAYRTALEPSYR